MRQKSFDVLIVGGGIIGASIAWKLALRGASVGLLERGEIGGEASSAGAGMLAPGSELCEDTPFARLMVESARQYACFVEDLQNASGLEIPYEQCGAIEYVEDQDPIAIASRLKAQRALGIQAASSPGSGTSPIPSLFYPGDGYVEPLALMNALKLACSVTTVTHLRRDVDRIKVTNLVEIGDYAAKHGVIAGGAWSGGIAIEGAPPLPGTKPVRGYLVSYVPGRRILSLIQRRGHTYVFQRRDGRVIAGASSREVGFDRSPSQEEILDIDTRAKQLVCELEGSEIERAWLGFRPAMQAGEPAIGRHCDSPLWLAYGHYRNGILGAPATAGLIAASLGTP